MAKKYPEGSPQEEAGESPAMEAQEQQQGSNKNHVPVAGHGKRTAHMVVSPTPMHPGPAAKC